MTHAEGVSTCMAIVYELDDDGWIIASIPAVIGVHSQGRTPDEARANVMDALRGVLKLRAGRHPQGPGVVRR
jgi:predicted RNase H-like HicB family nuclease